MPKNGLDDLDESLGSADLRRLSPAVLAYLGDAVYELFMRAFCLMPPRRLRSYHEQVVNQVRAESQAHYLQQLQPQLTPEEIDILRRGRNAASRGPKRVDPAVYQDATALETLLGYLYLSNRDRLSEILALLRPLVQANMAGHPPTIVGSAIEESAIEGSAIKESVTEESAMEGSAIEGSISLMQDFLQEGIEPLKK